MNPRSPLEEIIPREIEYADDVDFIGSDSVNTDEIQTELKKFHLNVNADKTELTILSRNETEWKTTKKAGSLIGDTENIERRKQLSNITLNKLKSVREGEKEAEEEREDNIKDGDKEEEEEEEVREKEKEEWEEEERMRMRRRRKPRKRIRKERRRGEDDDKEEEQGMRWKWKRKRSRRKSPQQGDLRLSGPSSGPTSGQGVGGGARTSDRRVPANLRADSLNATRPLTPL
ncbi:hypothetical protein PoB_005811500 [Plakobranchus ocellatus]|uniref:Reverse transcriptase domain-containing protein n=1 Tax=Plakobranchus ocellatus TaxID=259542 RepID=A0AAV4CIH6_9GAST|nr:hypothetical protein PoB_005811500 [Plakobranchus ocellatus]